MTSLAPHALLSPSPSWPAGSFLGEPCYHGGAFFDEVGADFRSLDRRHGIINADVLDAWFPPSPAVGDALRDDLDWLLRTSPPTQCEGLVAAIGEARRLDPASIVVGAGSSDLVF